MVQEVKLLAKKEDRLPLDLVCVCDGGFVAVVVVVTFEVGSRRPWRRSQWSCEMDGWAWRFGDCLVTKIVKSV